MLTPYIYIYIYILHPPGSARDSGVTMQREGAKADASHAEAPKKHIPRLCPDSLADALKPCTHAASVQDGRILRAAACDSELALQDFETWIQSFVACRDFKGAAALQGCMMWETNERKAVHRTEIVQEERLGEQVAEASPATPQKQTQLDATTDGA